MAGQAPLNRNVPPSLDGMLGGMGELGTNVVSLATLQARLAAADLREAGLRMAPAFVATALLVPLAVASATGALLGLGYWLGTALGLSVAQSFGLAALAGAVVCSLLAVVAWFRLRAGLVAFRRSRDELERNIAWLGTVLTQSGR